MAERENINFGLLKAKGMKIKQSQAQVFRENKNLKNNNFARLTNEQLIEIVKSNDLPRMRRLSRYFAQKNGIYARAIRLLADIYRFDWFIYPNLDLNVDLNEETQKKVAKRFEIVLEHFDSSAIQLTCRRFANQICLDGIYFGYICDDISDKLVIQDLPTDFCRSRFYHRGVPIVEFDLSYFDKVTKNTDSLDGENTQKQLLLLFPKEIQDGYRKFKANNDPKKKWMILDLDRAFKFNFYDSDIPPFIYAIPALINLEEIQDLEKEKLLQELQKILTQQFDLDQNGQIPFTIQEMQALNQNAVDMVGDAVGVSVLSTVAKVDLHDLSPSSGKESEDSVNAAENSVYNDLGLSQNLFNTDGNLSLEKSIIVDEAFVKQLALQFEQFFNLYLEKKFNRKDSKFRFKMLQTTIFNHIDLSDKYKDLTKLGFSRFIPMIALGHTQKEVISLSKLETEILALDINMLPPFSSNTMSSETWLEAKELQESIRSGLTITEVIDKRAARQVAQKAAASGTSENKGGRPASAEDELSDKTIANRESQ